MGSVLCAVLDRALKGNLNVVPNWASELLYGRKQLHIEARQLQKDLSDGFIWFDYLSVPQRDKEAQGLAVASIVSYVSQSCYFMVLAGAWVDDEGEPRDLRTWLGRGWCRMEQVSNALSLSTKPLIVAQSPSDVQTYGPGGISGRMWLFNPIGNAAFTVADDRIALGPILSDLIDARAAAALEDGTDKAMVTFRVLSASKRRLLEGTSIMLKEPLTLDEWMSEMHFSSEYDGGSSGWTPLRFAVLAGRVDLAGELLSKGVDVESMMSRATNEWGMPKGSTVLHLASYVRNDAKMVQLLLSHGADPRRVDKAAGFSALHFACCYGRFANITKLIECDHLLSRQPARSTGALPLPYLALLGHSETLQLALKELAQHLPDHTVGPGSPTNWCTFSVAQVGDVATLRTLLDAGFEHNSIGALTHRKFRVICTISDVMVRFLNQPRGIFIAMAFTSRATALHAAALTGNIGALNLLLEHSADPTSTSHAHALTPLHLAAYNGHKEIAQRLMDAGASAHALDKRRQTPCDWAKRRGHVELVDLFATSDRSVASGDDLTA